jgi:hypothetical protein
MNPWEYMSGMGGYGGSSPQNSLMPGLGEMVNSFGSYPSMRMLQSDINRNVLPGDKTPGIENFDPSQLAQMDRFAWGQQAGLGGLPLVTGYEGVKGLAQMPGMGSLMRGAGRIGDFIGIPNASSYVNFDQNTSPASGNNIAAYLRGALSGMGGFGR